VQVPEDNWTAARRTVMKCGEELKRLAPKEYTAVLFHTYLRSYT